MKKLLMFVVLICLTILISITAFAQKQKSKDEYLKEIATLSNTKKPEDTEKAYQLAKEFIVKFPKENNENSKKIKDFVKRYRTGSFYKAYETQNFADLFTIGKEILAEEPENTAITLLLGYGGYDAMLQKKDQSFVAESLKYAKLTIELMDKGNVPSDYFPFSNQQEALAWMYYISGIFLVQTDLKEAAGRFYKSTLYESKLKQSSEPYRLIADYYESVYEKLSKDLDIKVKAKTISDADLKTDQERIEKALDLMIDAYCRAYKLGEAEKNPGITDWKKRLTQVYLFRKKPEAALESFITFTVSTPLKDPTNF